MPSFALPEEREVPVGESGVSEVPVPGTGTPGSLEVAAVTIDRRNDGASIMLALDGSPTKVTYYTLTNPGRIVIDVFGDSRRKAKVDFMKVVDPLVRRVRVAHHDGRMRLVLDFATDAPPAYTLGTHDGTLLLSFGMARPNTTLPSEH